MIDSLEQVSEEWKNYVNNLQSEYSGKLEGLRASLEELEKSIEQEETRQSKNSREEEGEI